MPSSDEAPGPATSRMGVLLIEDQADVLDAVSMVLCDSGYQPIGGTTAHAVLQQAAELGIWPSAVICDYRLEDQYDGFDAITELRYEFGDALPAIMVTADVSPELQARAGAHGVCLIHKPIDRAQLLQALKTNTDFQ